MIIGVWVFVSFLGGVLVYCLCLDLVCLTVVWVLCILGVAFEFVCWFILTFGSLTYMCLNLV